MADNNTEMENIVEPVDIEELVRTFTQFLEEHRVGKDEEYTHVRVGYPSGKFNIVKESEWVFMRLYTEILDVHRQGLLSFKEYPDVTLNFAEKQGEVGPLMLDFDFKFNNNEENSVRQYTKNLVSEVISIVSRYIYELLYLDEDDIEAYLLEKKRPTPEYNKNNELVGYKDGFHIMYPMAFTVKQREKIYNETLRYFKRNGTFSSINCENSVESIYDNSTISRNNLMMYGSMKTIKGKARTVYTLMGKYDINGKQKYMLESREVKDIVIMLSVRGYTKDDELLYRNEEDDDNNDIEDDDEEYTRNIEPIKTPCIDTTEGNYNWKNEYEKKIFLAKNLLRLISKEKATEETTWIRVCWALQSISPMMEGDFIEWSKKAGNKFDEKGCKKTWKTWMEKTTRDGPRAIRCTINTLHKYAMEDNKEEYEKFMNKFIYPEFKKGLENTDTSVADYVYAKYGSRFVCSTLEKTKIWYMYNGNKWIRSEDGVDLRRLIQNEVANDYIDAANKLNERDNTDFDKSIMKKKEEIIRIELEIKNKEEESREAMKSAYTFDNIYNNEKDMIQKRIQMELNELREKKKRLEDEIHKTNDNKIKDLDREVKKYINVAQKLRNQTSLRNVMSACADKFYDSEFRNKLDDNPNLIGFNNGVLELITKDDKYENSRWVFRKGMPDDYISFSTNYDYKEFDGDEKEFDELNEYMSTLLMNKNIREYMMRYLASCLHGRNKEQSFTFFTGRTGSNGKSIFTVLLDKTFGDYYTPMKPEIITAHREGPQSASPETMRLKGKRIAIMQEPDAGDRINIAQVKVLSGGEDTIIARPLYEKPIEFKPQCRLIMICNVIPQLKELDGGIIRRLSVVPFSTHFVFHNPVNSTEVRANSHVSEKISKGIWNQVFMWYLVNVAWPIYTKEGLNPPKEVKDPTAQYINESDTIGNFIYTRYEYVKIRDEDIDNKNKDEERKQIILQDLYKEYRLYHRDFCTDIKIPPITKLKAYLEDNKCSIVENTGEVLGLKEKQIVFDNDNFDK